MGFTWSSIIAESDKIDTYDIEEIENKLNVIANVVLKKKPYLPVGTPGCPSNNPINGLYYPPKNKAAEQNADILSLNMDYVRENNWCRGHNTSNLKGVTPGICSSNKGTFHGTVNFNVHNTLNPSGHSSVQSNVYENNYGNRYVYDENCVTYKYVVCPGVYYYDYNYNYSSDGGGN